MEPDPWRERTCESIEILEDMVVRNLTTIVDLAVKNGQKLILCSILPTNMASKQRNRERNEYILKVNTSMKEICKDKGIIYVDYHSNFVDSDGRTLKDGLTVEGAHPHVIGYNLMADILRTTLEQNGIAI